MKTIILFLSISIASGVLLVNVYTSLIDARSWGSDVPVSIATARDYFKTVNPGNFFRIFSPVNQLLGLLVLVLFWKYAPAVRFYLGGALLMYLVAEAMTFGFFYPRNDIMFRTAQLTDIELLKRTVSEWQLMNWVRSLVLLTGLFFSFLSLHKIYSLH
ncbi:anthrone oxygenase family protein [Ferruginibacter profundus]